MIGYTSERVREFQVDSFAKAQKVADDCDVIWIDVVGLGNIGLLKEFGTLYGIHNLTLEDVVIVHQRAKSETFLRDCYDHVIQLQESIESYREVCSDLRDYHLAAIGNRTNEVMKTLTIVSTILISLGFLTGLYGMNFVFIPELQWRYGYFLLLGAMVAIVVGFLAWFRRRGWI